MVGVRPEGNLEFRLPELALNVTFRLDDDTVECGADLDTLIIEPDEARLVLIWRAAWQCGRRALQVKEIAVTQSAER